MTMTQPQIDIEAAQKEGFTVLYCDRCQRPLALSKAGSLHTHDLLGKPVRQHKRVTLWCECGRPFHWRPNHVAG